MAFQRVNETVKFPRDEHVDLHVRHLTLNADAPPSEHVEAVEIREWLKSGEIYGHGIIFPFSSISDVKVGLDRLERSAAKDAEVNA